MSRIRGKDTKPEMTVRRGLHALGFRFRLHDRRLPGRPDLVFPGRRAVIQVQGCFWHGHDCPMGVTPATNVDFWVEKIQRNIERDRRTQEALLGLGWRILTIWECALRGRGRLSVPDVITASAAWLDGDEASRTFEGRRGSETVPRADSAR